MDVSLVAYAVPVFFILMGIEYLVARRRGLRVFGYHDAITDLSCGIGSIVIGAAIKTVGLAGYTLVWTHFAVVDVSTASWAWWVAAMVLVDFAYYWFHRAGHRVNFIWAGHVVHHQSEEFNLAVALRQPWLFGLFAWLFHLPLAILGIPPAIWVVATTLNTLYQFWIHTETVGRLGPLEAVLNTPSHHRVHHATNPQYIDRNYGGILIIWDRMFGTFEPERAQPVYGTIEPLRSWNPLWANVEHWGTIARRLRTTPGLQNKVRVVLGPPGWTATGELVAPEVSRAAQKKYETRTPTSLDLYVAAHYVGAITATTAFMVLQTSWPWPRLAALAALIVAGITAWGGMFEGQRWGFRLEAARTIATAPLVWWASDGHVPATVGVAVAALVALPWLWQVSRSAAAPQGNVDPQPSLETAA